MTSPRNLLLIALLFLGYLLWAQWQEDYSHAGDTAAPPIAAAKPGETTPSTASPPAASSAEIPNATGVPGAASTPTSASTSSTTSPHAVVTTDVLRVEIDTRGGSVVAADLLAYPQEPKDFAHPVRILDSSASRYFEAQSGLVSAQGAAPDHTATFAAEKNDYTLADGADTIEVPLTWSDASGLQVRKVFVFKRASYVIEQRQ